MSITDAKLNTSPLPPARGNTLPSLPFVPPLFTRLAARLRELGIDPEDTG